VGFETAVTLGINGFQDQLLKPLRHLSFCIFADSHSPMTNKYNFVIILRFYGIVKEIAQKF
ncbi:MAG: hypothetical protein LIO74_10335, partial [Ruminococcus sp.]|nr:hypothetical protein [Ruminococcus sp.]